MKKHLIALPLFSAGLLFFSCQTTKPEPVQEPAPVVEPVPETINFDYQIHKEQASLEYIQWDYEYPEFTNNKILNSAVNECVQDYFKAVKLSAKESWDENTGYRVPFEFYNTIEEYNDTPNFISIRMDQYSYMGGAHGSPEKATINYDKNKNKLASITEVSGLSLEEISRLCYDTLLSMMAENEISDIQWIQNGTEPIEENFQVFTISKDEKYLTIFFNPYQVAPYAMGVLAVSIEL